MNTQRWNRIIAGAIMGLCLYSTAEAVITVNAPDDADDGGDGLCSLFEAITAVNTGADYNECMFTGAPETINIILPDPSTITLSMDLPTLDRAVTIAVPGTASVEVNGANMFRIFHITGTALAVTISNLTISNGGSAGGLGDGYGITTDIGSTLTLAKTRVSNHTVGGLQLAFGSTGNITDSTISNNTVDGIFSNGTLSLSRSTVSGNGAGGAGIQILGASIAQIINSTISSNKGTGILFSGTTLTMFSSTVTANVDDGLSISGDAIVDNTIISGNGDELTTFNCMGTVNVSSDYNLEGTDFCGFTAASNIVNTNPLLDGLKDNGGPTLTHALKGGIGASPAINKGDPANCGKTLVIDQRGEVRPSGSACDIGAYERQTGDRRRGGSGSGSCSLAGKDAAFDPTLWLLVLVSCIYLGYRRSYTT